jgi:glycosyltransferase involved in cell wall biosynthesis
MRPAVDILIPTCNRPAALAVTLTSLAFQSFRGFRLVISDQTDRSNIDEVGEVQAALRVLRAHGQPVEVYKHLPRRGMAEQRQFLLDQAEAAYALFLDDDLILEPFVVVQMLTAIREEGCGFVGSAVIGLSFSGDVRPHEQGIEFWEGRVQPEEVLPGSGQWQRYMLHNAANLYHLQQYLGLTPDRTRKYRVAWVGGCVMYDTAKLREAGGFHFWRDLPIQHGGEDVLAQLRVMRAYGGCGLIPSGVYHQELSTTVPDRQVNAPEVLGLDLVPALGSRQRYRVNLAARVFESRQPGNSGN